MTCLKGCVSVIEPRRCNERMLKIKKKFKICVLYKRLYETSLNKQYEWIMKGDFGDIFDVLFMTEKGKLQDSHIFCIMLLHSVMNYVPHRSF